MSPLKQLVIIASERFNLNIVELPNALIPATIYGLLGLANDCSEDELVVDYSKALYEVHRDVIMFHSSGART